MKYARVVQILAAAFLLWTPMTAGAHSEEPLSQRLFSVDDTWLLKGNFGLIGSSFDGFVCEEAFLGGDSYLVVPTAEFSWVTFGTTTIHRTDDGCDFQKVKDTLQLPADADGRGQRVVYLANAMAEAGIWTSDDAGSTFSRVDFDTSELQLTGIRFADDTTAYLSAYDRSMSGAAVLLSLDLGDEAAAVERLPVPDGLKYPYLLAASGDQVLWLGREEGQTIFWGTPDAPTQHAFPVETWPTGAVLSEDGTQAWVSGLELGKGLTIGVRGETDVAWTTVAEETTAACVARHQGETWVCTMRRFDDADLVRIADDGTITGVADYRDLMGSRSECSDATDVGDVCPLVWGEIARYLGLVDAPDAGGDMGTTDSASDAGEPIGINPLADNDDDGCAAVGTRHPTGITWLALFAFAFLGRRFRKG